jgi:hypothetical protein
MREETSFDQPRVAGYEKIVLTITSLVLVISLFMPWFSGYKEYEVTAATKSEGTTVTDSLGLALAGDSVGVVLEDSAAVLGTDEASGTGGEETSELAVGTETETAPAAEVEVTAPVTDERGFASITSAVKRKEYRKEFQSASAVTSLGLIGDVFSSGLVLKLTGLLFILYMLSCIVMAALTLYSLYGIKGSSDAVALKLKKMMKFGWIPVGIWLFCLIISFFGASYSFDSTDMIAQLGSSYGIATYLSLLSYGFYISLGCFIMNAVKAIEI